MPDPNRKELIDVAAGRRPADRVLRNAKIVNLASHEILEGDVALYQDRIVGMGDYEGREVLDLGGRFLCPGFIDAHVHIESSLLCVPEFARVVVSHGTTAVVADPHEFANVMGTEGISYVLRTAKHGPIDVYVMLSSCVPASPFESAGAELTAEDLEPFLANPWVLGLAEMMNYPGVVAVNPGVLEKIDIAADSVVDGHAPSLSGRELTAYAASGVMSDHECITAPEAAEKLRRGLYVMVREGSQTHNLDALLPLVTPATADRFMFCTDDKDVRDLIEEGHIDHMVRRAIAQGLDPILAIRLASFNTARYFGLRRTGAILPGYRADLVVLEDLKTCRVRQVFRRGLLAAEDGRCLEANATMEGVSTLRSSINVQEIDRKDFAIPVPAGAGPDRRPDVHIIEVLDNRIDTDRSIEPAMIHRGELVADPARDLAKIVVIERHRASGEVARGFVRGFKLRAGALASSISHDAHNLITVGMNDADMCLAVKKLVSMQGGLVVVCEGGILANVRLPIAGLVTDQPAEATAEKLRALTEAARSLGCALDQPFMALSFLSLSVIGKLKLTNQGLIDVEKLQRISLVVDGSGIDGKRVT